MEKEKVLVVAYVDANRPFQLPIRKYDGDAGYDLSCATAQTIEPGQHAIIDTNTRVQLPEGTWALLTARSSTFHKLGLICHTGIIDNGYRGELFSSVYNPSKEPVHIEVGDRLTQLILMNLVSPGIHFTYQLETSDRDTNGFGSTGK